MASDIEIAQAATPRPITEIAEALNIPDEALEPYGRIKGKVSLDSVSYTHLTLPTIYSV